MDVSLRTLRFPEQGTHLAALHMFASFRLSFGRCSPSRRANPQSGATINLSASMYSKASESLPCISSTVSTLLLDTFMVPRMTLVLLNNPSKERSFVHQASSIDTESTELLS